MTQTEAEKILNKITAVFVSKEVTGKIDIQTALTLFAKISNAVFAEVKQ